MATKTAWDTDEGTASAAIDTVLMQATRPLTLDEIQATVQLLGLPARESPSPHLTTLKQRGYITNEGGRWSKTPLGESRCGR
jgi:hypothetical protein